MRFINTDRYSATHIDWHKFIYAGRKPDNMHRRNYSWQFIQILTVLCATLSALVKKGVVISRVGTDDGISIDKPSAPGTHGTLTIGDGTSTTHAINKGQLDAKFGTGDSQVRSNTQMDARYVLTSTKNTAGGFAGVGTNGKIESKLQDVSGSGTPVLSAHWVQRRDAMWAGFAPADGQLLKRADYPDAWAAIEAGKVPVTTDAIWLAAASNRGGFSTGDGSTTFRVPDYNGKSSGSLGAAFLRGDGLNSAGTGGVIQGDAIRNITGSFGGSNATPFHSVDARHTNGAMKTVGGYD